MSDEELRDTADPIVSSEVDTQPVTLFQTEQELQSSCDTYMSQQSDLDEQDFEQKGSQERSQNQTYSKNNEGSNEGTEKSKQLDVVNSSMEVETNDSSHNESDILTEQEKSDYTQAQDKLEEDIIQDSAVKKRQQMKRKAKSENSPVSLKKFRQDTPTLDFAQDNCSLEVVPESPEEKHRSAGIVEISSTSEKTINLEDSQEFSLRIEDTSPTNSQTCVEKSQEASSWKSHSNENPVTPEHGLSQKSSWSSHQDQSLSWSSHKDADDKCPTLKNEESLKEVSDEKNGTLSPEVSKGDGESGGKGQQVWDERLLLGTILWTVEDNKVVSGEIKQLSLVEDPGSNEKPGRMSIMSSSSYKTSSSSGSVGLPGPFTLPGHTRLSVMSSTSNSTSSSLGTGCRPVVHWDGPFLKPTVPDSKPVLMCGYCHTPYLHCDKTSSPVVNGGSKLPKIEELVNEKSSRKRIRGKGSGSSQSQSQSSGTLLEGTSSSDSLPQAASTPTPVKRGRQRKKPSNFMKKEVTTPTKTKVASPGHTPMPARTLALPHSPTTPLHDKGEAVLAKWAGDGRYYPGWAKRTERSTQSLVHFCDGQRKLMSSTWVVRANIITPGTLILVTVNADSCEYEEWIVVKVEMEGPELVFQVERDKDSRDVPFSGIALLEAQVAELTMADAQRAATPLNFNDVSLENIVSHPRKRSARTPLKDFTSSSVKKKKRQVTPEPTTSNGQTFGGPDSIYMDTDSSTHSSCSLDLRGREIKPLDVECSPPEVEEDSRLKLSHYRRNKSFKSKRRLDEAEPEHLVRMMGPIPEQGSDLFAGCVFLITYTSEVGLQRSLDVGTSYEDGSDCDGRMPVWKERLRMQIKNGGGKVYQMLTQVAKDELANTYLITDKPCNTPLYLQCLVNCIPIYSTSIIQKCCTQNRPFKEMIALRTTKKLLFLAVRNAEGGFYVCQAMQNIYKSSPRIRIRWLSQEGGKDTYSPDFYDHTDFDCILTNLNLDKVDKEKFRLPLVEQQRTESILKRALDVEKGVSEKPPVTEEHPDGLDLSLFRDESQLKKSSKSRSRNSSSGKKSDSAKSGDSSGEEKDDEDEEDDDEEEAEENKDGNNKKESLTKSSRKKKKSVKKKPPAEKKSAAKTASSSSKSTIQPSKKKSETRVGSKRKSSVSSNSQSAEKRSRTSSQPSDRTNKTRILSAVYRCRGDGGG